MRWDRDGAQLDLAEAIAGGHGMLRTTRIKGAGDPALTPWTLPYRGQQLAGDALRERLGDWQDRGIIEPSAADALRRCMVHPQWFDLSDRAMSHP